MTDVVLGTAHLFGLADEATSRRLLQVGWDAGARRLDTAPLYGGGRSEVEVGDFLDGRDGVRSVTTKVGLEPRTGRRSPQHLLRGAVRRLLPDRASAALAQGLDRRASRPTGRFGAAEVRTSVERSLRRLHGRVDRLLLHEVSPHDLDDELLALLRSLLDAGDVGTAGTATANALTAAAVARGEGLLTVVHQEVGPLSSSVTLPPSVTTRVGHGLLGGDGAHLAALQDALREPVLAQRWRDSVSGTPFEGPAGLPEALLARAAHLPVDEVLVATTRPDRLPRSVSLARGDVALPPAVLEVVDAAAAAARR